MRRRHPGCGWAGTAATLLIAASVLSGCGSAGSVATTSGNDPSDPAAAASGVPGSGSQRYAATGRVLMPDGSPVSNVLVSAVSVDDPPSAVPELAVLTDPQGRWAWPSLGPGRYEFRAGTKVGNGRVRLSVTARDTATADITLQPGS